MTKLWWVNTFVGSDADGNATCVVLDERSDVEWDRWGLARVLRAPDTVFVSGATAEGQRRVRFFSPHEGEMTFCGQGLIAADAVLRRALTDTEGAFTLLTAAGTVGTRGDAVHRNISWFDVPRAQVSAPSEIDLGPLLGPSSTPATLVDSGRKRAFVRLNRESDVQSVRLAPERVMALCEERALSGVCFYTSLGDGKAALRVFTVSLNGREDASTGGAVLGLARLLPLGRWEVAQGHGHRLSRGTLWLENAAKAPLIGVGGQVDIVASGSVAHEDTFGAVEQS